MSSLTLTAESWEGKVSAIPSKSYAIRILICAALADKPTHMMGYFPSNDIQAAIHCLKAMGARIEFITEDSCVIYPFRHSLQNYPSIDCGESGTLLRFLIPVIAALGTGGFFTGQGRLCERPLMGLLETLTKNGIMISDQTLPFSIAGKLSAASYKMDASVSSQYISGMLLAMPLLHKNCRLLPQGTVTSAGYVDMTLQVMRQFGVQVNHITNGYSVRQSQEYISPVAIKVEGDWSNAATLFCGAAVNGKITITELHNDSLQKDRNIISILQQMGAKISLHKNSITVEHAPLKSLEINLEDTPDLAPILSAVCACANGTSRLYGVERLRLKETDRLQAILDVLEYAGISCRYANGCLEITGGKVSGGHYHSYNDHRMVMMETILALKANGPVLIEEAQAIDKSYPTYIQDLQTLRSKICLKQ